MNNYCIVLYSCYKRNGPNSYRATTMHCVTCLNLTFPFNKLLYSIQNYNSVIEQTGRFFLCIRKNISKNIFLYNLRYRTFIILWFNWVSFHIRPRWTILRGKKFTKTVQTARWRRLYQKMYMMNERFEIIFWRGEYPGF